MSSSRLPRSLRELFRFRPTVTRLESREVPGQTTGSSLPWATWLVPYQSFLDREMSRGDIGGVIAGAPAASRGVETAAADAENDAPAISIVTPSKEFADQPVRNFGAERADVLVANYQVSDLSSSTIDESDFAPAPQSVPMASGSSVAVQHAAFLDNSAMSSSPATSSLQAGVGAMPLSLGNDFGAIDSMAAAIASQGMADVGGDAAPMLQMPDGITPNASSPSGYSPAQMRHAYGFDLLTQTGAGQGIWIIDAYNDPNITSDLHTFDAQFGLADPTFNIYYAQGSKPRSNGGWAQEISLDVEWAHAIAPGATINLVEAASNSNSNLYGAVDYAINHGGHILSLSWGGSDSSGESSYDSHFNHAGVATFVSSGDTGGAVQYPSASPYVVSVGGTSLHLNSDNTYNSESAWSSGGGGASKYEAEPTYQKNYGISLSGRGTPDVSYNADPNTGVSVYDSYSYLGQSGWLVFGGTSAAAPQWAALAALVDQTRLTPLDSTTLTSRFDYNAATAAYSVNYHDVTTGSNGYAATTGYDLATGLGSPVANTLVPWLIAN